MSNTKDVSSKEKEIDIKFYPGLIKFGENNLRPEKMQHLKQLIQMVEKRTNIKVEDYVNFGDKGSAQYKLYTR